MVLLILSDSHGRLDQMIRAVECTQPDTSIQNIAYLVAGFTFAIGIAYLIVCYVTRKALKEDCEK